MKFSVRLVIFIQLLSFEYKGLLQSCTYKKVFNFVLGQ